MGVLSFDQFPLRQVVVPMSEYQAILSLLKAERERYTQEAAFLENRLKLVYNQINFLDNLKSGYAVEEETYSQSKPLSYVDSKQPGLHEFNLTVSDSESVMDEQSQQENENESHIPMHDLAPTSLVVAYHQFERSINEPKVTDAAEPDISDIPKLTNPRKPGALPLLPEFQEYKIQNAILIVMRRCPNAHMHINAIVQNLYGNLSAHQLKIAKTSVASALSLGSKMGFWYRVMGTDGVYALNCKN